MRKRFEFAEELLFGYVPLHTCVPSRHPSYITRFSKLVRSIITQSSIYCITFFKCITCVPIDSLIVVYSILYTIIILVLFLSLFEEKIAVITVIA